LAPLWIGGFLLDGKWTLLTLHVADSGTSLSATIDVPSLKITSQSVSDFRRQSSLVSFRLSLAASQLTFEGRLDKGAIEGTVVSGSQHGRFQLLQSVSTDRASLAQYVGAYQWGPEHFVYIQFWDELGKDQLAAFDESGEMRALYQADESKFFAGSGLAFPIPAEARIVFQRNARGAVTSLRWEPVGKVATIAQRVELYTQTDVAFQNGNVRLAGTLTLPKSAGKHPVIILLHGSGPEDRDYLLPFILFAVRHGVALLAYDKRGVGGSTGDWKKSSFNDLAGDALAALDFLKSRNDIEHKEIGVFGVSQGGWIGPLVASQAKDIAFVISVSGPAVTPAEETLDYMQSELRINGTPPNEIEEAVSLTKLAYSYAQSGEGWDSYISAREKLTNKPWLPYIGVPATPDDPEWTFMRLIYFYDPEPALKELRCPTLALFGGRDLNVLPEKNRAKWESALREAGNHDYTLLVFPNGNHALMEATTGSLKEFPSLKQFVPEYSTTLLTWMSRHLTGFHLANHP
jgi:pimeloyl-ACP methyl ester carboxylesterase